MPLEKIRFIVSLMFALPLAVVSMGHHWGLFFSDIFGHLPVTTILLLFLFLKCDIVAFK
ncbi:MAG: hypothetical protein AB1633_07105 [Elusimicrobiota bacterium]